MSTFFSFNLSIHFCQRKQLYETRRGFLVKVEVDRSKMKQTWETSWKNECSLLQKEEILRDFSQVPHFAWCGHRPILSGNQRQNFLTRPMKISLLRRLLCEMHLWPLFKSPTSPSYVWNCYQALKFCYCTVCKAHNPLQMPRKNDGWSEKLSEPGFLPVAFETRFAPQPRELFAQHTFHKRSENGAFNILTSKFSSHHSRVHFFNSSTSESALQLGCF